MKQKDAGAGLQEAGPGVSTKPGVSNRPVTGRAIAQVEGLSEARLHRDRLVSAGLTAEIAKV